LRPTEDPCNGETWEGRCEGDVVIWCEDGEVKSIDCGAYDKDRGYDTSNRYYTYM
jgi:hypothetical protein